MLVRTNESKAAAAASIGARLALRERSVLMGGLRSCFVRTQTWQQAGKYVNALASELPSRNGWSVAEHAGDRTPDRTQRLLNRASWDEMAAMSQVRRHVVAGLDGACCRQDRGRAGRRKRMSCWGCCGRVSRGPEPWLQAGKYVAALVSELPKRNGWTIAEHAGDRTPDRTQRLLNRAAWDTFAAMSEVRRFAVAGLEEAAGAAAGAAAW